MKTHTITIKGKFPNLNDYVGSCRTNRYAAANMIKKAEENIVMQLLFSKLNRLHPPIVMTYTYYEPNKRRDKDNIAAFFHKVFQDALMLGGYIENDGWDYIESWTDEFDVDKINPRIEIKIWEV